MGLGQHPTRKRRIEQVLPKADGEMTMSGFPTIHGCVLQAKCADCPRLLEALGLYGRVAASMGLHRLGEMIAEIGAEMPENGEAMTQERINRIVAKSLQFQEAIRLADLIPKRKSGRDMH